MAKTKTPSTASMENIYTLDGKVPLLKSIPFGLQMIGSCGFTQRNITIAALSLSIGLGFTQVPEMFDIFPSLVRTVFAENCVAVVFLSAIIMNLLIPKEKTA